MNKSIRNIFAITALVLTFAPALRCEDTQTHTVSTSKLQSAINYIKNIRTPLTPQETLAQHIVRADIAGFKSDYDAFLQSNVTLEERTVTLQTLAITIQEIKQTLQTELDTMGNKVKKSTLAKGLAQTIFGTYCTFATMFSLAYKGAAKKEYKAPVQFNGNFTNYYVGNLPSYKQTLMNKLSYTLGESLIGYPVVLPQVISETIINEKLAALTNIILTPLTGYLAYNSLKSGLKNCKNGWNYKAFVEQQIANIDEINTFIQTQLN